MKKIALLIPFVLACTDPDTSGEACPAGVTRIGGDRVDCTTPEGNLGVCLETPAGATCVPRCREVGRTALCEAPAVWYSMPLDGESICFCFDPNR